MKIEDKTPYRSEDGEIDIIGQIQGTLKYGLSWSRRIQAQDTVIAIIEKQLNNSYILLRNVDLPNTDINLPLVLVGPAGVFLINVAHEHGVYIARDEEWGTMIGDRFVPASINHVKRTSTFARVLQLYLDRQGFKGMFAVDPILMAADPGMHIESTRPLVRIVMSDALERFAASLAQGRVVLNAPAIHDVARAILVGRTEKATPEASVPAPAPVETGTPAFGGYTSDESETKNSDAFSPDSFGYSFDESPDDEATPQTGGAGATVQAESAAPAKPAARKRKAKGGLTRKQWITLAVMIVFWLCVMAGFGIYIYLNYFTHA